MSVASESAGANELAAVPQAAQARRTSTRHGWSCRTPVAVDPACVNPTSD